MEDKLKPCPFCGGEDIKLVENFHKIKGDNDPPKIRTKIIYPMFIYMCNDCKGGFLTRVRSPELAKQLWNTRADKDKTINISNEPGEIVHTDKEVSAGELAELIEHVGCGHCPGESICSGCVRQSQAILSKYRVSIR